MKNYLLFLLCIAFAIGVTTSCNNSTGGENDMNKYPIVPVEYHFPPEYAQHEGTWLQWPHEYQYGLPYRNHLEPTFIAMTKALVGSEKVHIIAYNMSEQNRISNLLDSAGIARGGVDFYRCPTNDVWVRDNGPIFVNDSSGGSYIENWNFNGWGLKMPYKLDNAVPATVGNILNSPVIDLTSRMVIEGGAYVMDGAGTLMATRSAILNKNRNPNLNQKQIENLMTQYLGAQHFIWLNGTAGSDITDMHIDGFAQFIDSTTIVTMTASDLDYWQLTPADIDTLYAAKRLNGQPYGFRYLPLTAQNVVTSYGKNLGYKGSYVNYYVANRVVLVPIYLDANDEQALSTIRLLYPNKHVIGIDSRNLFAEGGMVHCVTQQQAQ